MIFTRNSQGKKIKLVTLAAIIFIHRVLALIPSTAISRITINKSMIILSKKHDCGTYIITRKSQGEVIKRKALP